MQKSYKIAIVILLGLPIQLFATENQCRFVCSASHGVVNQPTSSKAWVEISISPDATTCGSQLPEVIYDTREGVYVVICSQGEVLRRKLGSSGENAIESIYCCSQ